MMTLRYIAAVLLFAAFASQSLAQPITPPAPTLTIASTSQPPTQTPFPTPSVTPPPSPITLRFWLPDTLAGLDNVDAGDVLADYILVICKNDPAAIFLGVILSPANLVGALGGDFVLGRQYATAFRVENRCGVFLTCQEVYEVANKAGVAVYVISRQAGQLNFVHGE